jgi:alginate O-acetyltransferase complex protein AlgI
VMGFKLMDNFNRPYFSKSISEFWKRWHISLSTWFRDYLYISLGGNRVPKWRWQMNLFLTFLISGLWHGASWTYVIWGAINGLYLIAGLWTRKARERLWELSGLSRYTMVKKTLQVVITFFFTCIAWIFFRARTIGDAWYVLTHLLSGVSNALNLRYLSDVIGRLGLGRREFLLAVVALVFLIIVQIIQRRQSIRHILSTKPAWLRWGMYYAMGLGIVYLGVFGNNNFIYFQF